MEIEKFEIAMELCKVQLKCIYQNCELDYNIWVNGQSVL